MPPASTPAAQRPSAPTTRARSSTCRPPIVCVIDAITRTAATVPAGASNGSSGTATRGSAGAPPTTPAGAPAPRRRRLDHLRNRPVAHALLEGVRVEQVERAGAGTPRRRLHDVRLGP